KREMDDSMLLRAQLVSFMDKNRGEYLSDIVFAIANIIDVARAANQKRPFAEWQFRGVGKYFTAVLVPFLTENAKQVMSDATDLVKLVVGQPLLVEAYLAAVGSDPGMWTGRAEERALVALFAENKRAPIRVLLPVDAPAADMAFSTDEGIARALDEEERRAAGLGAAPEGADEGKEGKKKPPK